MLLGFFRYVNPYLNLYQSLNHYPSHCLNRNHYRNPSHCLHLSHYSSPNRCRITVCIRVAVEFESHSNPSHCSNRVTIRVRIAVESLSAFESLFESESLSNLLLSSPNHIRIGITVAPESLPESESPSNLNHILNMCQCSNLNHYLKRYLFKSLSEFILFPVRLVSFTSLIVLLLAVFLSIWSLEN